MKKMNISLALALALIAAVIFIAWDDEVTDHNISPKNFIIPSVNATDDYWFAGERLPVENFDVRERLERELIVNTYRHSTTILNLKNSKRYFAVIEPILKEYGIPDDFKYVAVAESDFSNATSPAGARGFWQIMKSTAKDFDLEVNDYVDERLHLEKATKVACQHLRNYYEKFGSWLLAAAAYNMGAKALHEQVQEQKTTDYFNLNLSEETNRYIFRIVAIKYIFMNPQQYGFDFEEEDFYPPLDKYSIVAVDTALPNLADFAAQYNVSYRMLKLYNPWLRETSLPNPKGKVYFIKIPRQ